MEEYSTSTEGEYEDSQKIKNYERYSIEFFEKVCNEHKVRQFASLNTTILPIKFFRSRDNRDCEGYTIFENNQSEIRIFLVDKNGDVFQNSEIEQAIRHEVLHYALMMCEYNSDDDSAVFHILCNFYDANAYMEMPEYEKSLYEKFYYLLENSSQHQVEAWLLVIGAHKNLELLINKKIDLLETIKAHKGIFERQYNVTKKLIKAKQKFIEKCPERKDEINKL